MGMREREEESWTSPSFLVYTAGWVVAPFPKMRTQEGQVRVKTKSLIQANGVQGLWDSQVEPISRQVAREV